MALTSLIFKLCTLMAIGCTQEDAVTGYDFAGGV